MLNQRRIIRVVLLCIATTVLHVHAQSVSLLYEVQELIKGTVSEEKWTITRKNLSPAIFSTEKTTSGAKQPATTETSTATYSWWTKESHQTDEQIFQEEFLSDVPYHLSTGETGFGYIRTREVKTNKILESWPVFISVEKQTRFKKITFTSFISNNRIMTTSRIYVNDLYLFPLLSEIRVYKPGIDPLLVPTISKGSDYYETFIVITIKKQE